MERTSKRSNQEPESVKSEEPLKNPIPDELYKEAYKKGFGDGFDKANELMEVEEEDDEPYSDENE